MVKEKQRKKLIFKYFWRGIQFAKSQQTNKTTKEQQHKTKTRNESHTKCRISVVS